MRRGNGHLLFSSRGARFAQVELFAVAAMGGYLAFLPLRTWPDLSTLCLLLLGLLALYSPPGLRPRLGRVDYIVLSFVVCAVACSSVFSEQPYRGMRFLVYVCLNLFLLVMASTVAQRSTLRLVALCIGLIGALHLSLLLISSHALGDASAKWVIDSAGMATLIVPNDALVVGLCLPSLAFAFAYDRNRLRVTGIALVLSYLALGFYASYLLQSKIAALSLGSAALAYLAATTPVFRRQRLPAHRVSVFLGALALMLLTGAAGWYLGNQSTTRLSLWVEAVTSHSSLASVLFGAGPNSFLFNPFSADVGFDHGNFIVPWAHNLYLETYYEQGLFGLSAVTLLTLVPLWRALRIENRDVRALIVATMLTFCLVALFEVTLTRRFYFAMLVIFYGLSAAQSREVSDE